RHRRSVRHHLDAPESCVGLPPARGPAAIGYEITSARALVGLRHLTLDASARTAALDRAGMALNLGAIGKGFAVQAIGAALWRRGVRHALVSAGGSSVIALGGPDRGWRVDVM